MGLPELCILEVAAAVAVVLMGAPVKRAPADSLLVPVALMAVAVVVKTTQEHQTRP